MRGLESDTQELSKTAHGDIALHSSAIRYAGRVADRLTTITRNPDPPPPALRCPQCDVLLIYERTTVSGAGRLERWDAFTCRTHGAFEYRHRTGKLRPVLST
jgi:hypothetical protein